jgi:chaperonin GroES
MVWMPLWDKVVVRREAPDETLSESIVAAEAYQKKKRSGVVVATGGGRLTSSGAVVPLVIQVGMRVLFGEHSGVDLEEKDAVMLREDEILAYDLGGEGVAGQLLA